MRCVLDPNVLVSALLSRRGTPAQLIRVWLDGNFELVASPMLLSELRRVLDYPKIRARVSAAESEAFLDLLNQVATIVEDPEPSTAPPTADPQDDYLVALGRVSRAVIVSGDKHLLDLGKQLPVFTPATFLRTLGPLEGE